MEQRTRSNALLNTILIIVSIAVAAAVLFPVFARDGGPFSRPAYRTGCLNNLKQIGIAFSMYLQDNDNKFPELATTKQTAPEGKSWPDLLSPYIKNTKILRCPKVEDRLTYSYNRKVSGLSAKDIGNPDDLVLLFDSVSDSQLNNNLNGDIQSVSSNGGLPSSGQYTVYAQDWKKPLWGYPKWAVPNHIEQMSTSVLYADNHVGGLSLSTTPTLEPTKVTR